MYILLQTRIINFVAIAAIGATTNSGGHVNSLPTIN